MRASCACAVQDADIAAAPLTNNTDRARVVEFVDPPFMKFGLSILIRKRDKSKLKIDNMLALIARRNENKIKYGCVKGGTTDSFFLRSPVLDADYRQMHSVMNADKTLLDGMTAAVQKVRQSTDRHPFAFIGEHNMLVYHASREPCDLTVVPGGIAAYKGEYHLAVRKLSGTNPLKNQLKTALERVNASGALDRLYKKWWTDRSQCDWASSATSVGYFSGMFVLVPIVAILL